MKLFIAATVLMMSALASAATLDVDCKAPTGWAGNSATVKGTLTKSATRQQGYYTVAGKLKIVVGGSYRHTLYSKTVSVKGVILDDGSYNLVAEKNPELTAIYLNNTRRDVSSVEVNGKGFKSNCAK